MSEYQYFEFRAIDGRLQEHDMQELRALSRRARITPTSFRNSYNWAEFRGNPDELMDRYFDAFVHVASWGLHRLMFRMPKPALNAKTVKPYTSHGTVSLRTTRRHVVLGFEVEDEESSWDDEGDGWLDSLIGLRADLVCGDARVLYLGWLIGVSSGKVEDSQREPPVPPGLGELTPALESFADFFEIEPDLIAAAAAPIPPGAMPSQEELAGWLGTLPAREKEELLARSVFGHAVQVRAEVLRSYESATSGKSRRKGKSEVRTAGELRAAAEASSNAAGGGEGEQRGRKKERERARTSERMQSREAEGWREVDGLIEDGNCAGAIELLQSLRSLSNAMGHSGRYAEHILAIRQAHAANEELMELMDESGLGERQSPPARAARRRKSAGSRMARGSK